MRKIQYERYGPQQRCNNKRSKISKILHEKYMKDTGRTAEVQQQKIQDFKHQLFGIFRFRVLRDL